jgi:hypothetical protein
MLLVQLYEKMQGLPVHNVLSVKFIWGVLVQNRPIRFFKFVWGLPAGTDDPKNEVVDNLPHYGS